MNPSLGLCNVLRCQYTMIIFVILNNRMLKPTVFVGCAYSEGSLKVARLLKEFLREDLDIKIWDEPEVFKLSTTTFENLIKVVEEYDFGIFIFSPEGELIRNNKLQFPVTGNVIFEFGLFLGYLGRNRTFVVQNKSNEEVGISDLSGMTVAKYSWDERNGEDELREALSKVAEKILHEVKREGKKINEKKELAALYRIVNAICPSYPDAKVEELNLINCQQVERFREIRDIEEFIQDMIKDYIYSILNKQQKSVFRIYFAYYIGDGLNIDESNFYSYCIDQDINENPFKGEFIIALSNPNALEESMWRVGRAIPGFDNGDTLSNCARVFQSGVASSKPNLQDLQSRASNYLTQEELALYTEPIEWRTTEGNSRVGVLAVSSKEPNSIEERIKQRINFLAVVIGQIFSLYAMSITLNSSQKISVNTSSIKSLQGFNGDQHLNMDFVNRTIVIRREISKYFELKFIKNNIHRLENGELKCNR